MQKCVFCVEACLLTGRKEDQIQKEVFRRALFCSFFLSLSFVFIASSPQHRKLVGAMKPALLSSQGVASASSKEASIVVVDRG